MEIYLKKKLFPTNFICFTIVLFPDSPAPVKSRMQTQTFKHSSLNKIFFNQISTEGLSCSVGGGNL